MTRTTRILTALTATVPLTMILLTGTAMADTTGGQLTGCRQVLVCAPVNAPLDLSALGPLIGHR